MRQRPNTFITTIIGLLLYLLTIVAEVISIAIRFWIGYTVGQAVIPSTAPPLAQAFPFFVIGPIFAFAPVVWGIIALLGLPSGGILTRYELDGRAPTAAEREIVEGALTELMTVQPGIRRPRKWFMSNTIEPDTLVIGTTLYIRSDLLQKDPQYLKGFLAHALGHFNTLDSRLIEALKRLQIRVVYFLTYAFDSLNLSVLKEDQAAPNQEKSASDLPNMNISRERASSQRVGGGLIALLDIILTVIAGGLGLRIMSPLWRSYFYTCEYGADGYAVSLGQGEVVARIVDDLNTPLDVPFDWMWGREGTSKYVQKRLALLRQQPVISTKLGT